MSPNKNKKSPTKTTRKMGRSRKRSKYRKEIREQMQGASLRSNPKEELKELNQLKAAIVKKWNADLYYKGSHITHGLVFYKEEVIEINESAERCEAAIESARKRDLAHAREEIQMKERGNDCNLYPSALESAITHCQRVDKRYTEGLKEKKCAKENELAVPGAPVPVAAPIPDAVAVAVVDTDPLYDQDVDESKLDPKLSNKTDFYAEGLDNSSAKESSLSPLSEVARYVQDARNSEKFAPPLENEDQSCIESEEDFLDNSSAKESSLSPSSEFTQYVQDARNSEKFAPPLENEDQSCTESEEDLLSEDYLSIENGRLIVEPLFTYKLSWSRSFIGSSDMNLSSDGSSDSNGEDEDEVSWVDG